MGSDAGSVRKIVFQDISNWCNELFPLVVAIVIAFSPEETYLLRIVCDTTLNRWARFAVLVVVAGEDGRRLGTFARKD